MLLIVYRKPRLCQRIVTCTGGLKSVGDKSFTLNMLGQKKRTFQCGKLSDRFSGVRERCMSWFAAEVNNIKWIFSSKIINTPNTLFDFEAGKGAFPIRINWIIITNCWGKKKLTTIIAWIRICEHRKIVGKIVRIFFQTDFHTINV